MKKNFYIDLHLFDGAAAATATSAASTASDAGQTGEETNSQLANGKKGETKVLYGKQPEIETVEPTVQENPAAEDTQQTQVDKKALFEDLIKGEYKDEFSARTQEIINNRFKETKSLQKSLQQADPIMQMLARRYGVDTNNYEAIQQALLKDDALFEEEALQHGMDVDQYRQFITMQQENERLQKLVEEHQKQEDANNLYADWMKQADELKQLYPEFDLIDEIQNPNFMKLLEANVDVKTAFNVVHMDDIVKGAVKQTAATVQQKVVNSVKSKSTRPVENGSANQPGVIIKNDVTKLTDKDRLAIIEEARRGKQISF